MTADDVLRHLQGREGSHLPAGHPAQPRTGATLTRPGGDQHQHDGGDDAGHPCGRLKVAVAAVEPSRLAGHEVADDVAGDRAAGHQAGRYRPAREAHALRLGARGDAGGRVGEPCKTVRAWIMRLLAAAPRQAPDDATMSDLELYDRRGAHVPVLLDMAISLDGASATSTGRIRVS